MQLNSAVFEYNGRSGYIMKPELMRRKDRTLDPFTESPLDGVVPAVLTIRILSGLMLSFKRISSFVEVDMYGIVVGELVFFHIRWFPSRDLQDF